MSNTMTCGSSRAKRNTNSKKFITGQGTDPEGFPKLLMVPREALLNLSQQL